MRIILTRTGPPILAHFTKKKEAEFLHGKKIVTTYVVETRQIFTDFTACRISASSLKVVHFWSILTIQQDPEFLHLG